MLKVVGHSQNQCVSKVQDFKVFLLSGASVLAYSKVDVCYSDTFLSTSTSCGDMKYAVSAR